MTARFVTTMIAASWLAIGAPAHAAGGTQYNGRFPAKFPEAARLQSIAVLPFTGTDGADFAEALSAELRSALLDGRPYFTVRSLDGMIVPAAIVGQARGKKGKGAAPSDEKVDQGYLAYAIAKGRQLGVDAVYLGRVTIQSLDQRKSTKNNSICAKSAGLFKCSESRTTAVACNTVSLEFSVVPKAIRVRDGEVVYSETISGHGEYSTCDDQTGTSLLDLPVIFGKKKNEDGAMPENPTTPAGLFVKVRGEAAAKIRRAVAPYNRSVLVYFKKIAPELSKTDQTEFKGAVAFADGGRIDRACPMFLKLLTPSTSNSVNILYNLGVCEEALNPDTPASAFSYYAKADALLMKPDKLVSDGFMRTKAMIDGGKSINTAIKAQAAPKPGRAK